MKIHPDHRPQLRVFFQGLFIYTWLCNLAKTDSYFSVYILCAAAGVLCLCRNYRRGYAPSGSVRLWMRFLAGVFSLATLLANYPLFQPVTALLSLFNLGCSFLGGMAVGWNVLLCFYSALPRWVGEGSGGHAAGVFLGVFGSVAVIDLMYLFCVRYPGVLTTDSVTTIRQITEGVYNNTMPFWHTMTVKVFYQLGLGLFGTPNAGAACFHCAQILFLAACFGYALTTLYQMSLPKGWLVLVYGVYALLPYNIVYSVALWKDVLFSGAALMLVTAFCRILRKIGRKNWNLLLFALGGLGLCLWRTNGLYVFLAVTLVVLLTRDRRLKQVKGIMIGVSALGLVLNGPVLSLLGVAATDLVEAFAVPFQQIARVVAEGLPLTQGEEELLSQAFRLDKIQALYDPTTVDPIKFQAFRRENLDWIRENLWEYGKLYCSLGLRYPGTYLEAWIDLTKGYWNGGYAFWIYTKGVAENDLGLYACYGQGIFSRLYSAWFRYLEKAEILQFLYSIGLHVWALVSCFFVNLWKKRREYLLTLPLLVLAAGLWLGTPVYAEFRYAYPVFLTLPVILSATVFQPEDRPIPDP